MATTVEALSGAPVQLPEDRLEELRAQLRGSAFGAAERGPADSHPPFNAMYLDEPAITVRCSGAADVVDAVNFARREGLLVAVRGGGHSIAGLSSSRGGVLIDLGPMRGVVVDPERRLAHVQGGALWGDVDRETQRFGLATPGGVVSDTGVAGLTLGGGYGWLRRKYGLSSDNVVAAQVVLADGRVVTASEDQNADLYWALRGGGGNFGIVTAFMFRLHPVGPDVGFSATFYPLEELAAILRGYRAATARFPDDVTATVVTMTFPANPELPEAIHDRPVAIVGGVHAGGDPAEGLDVMAPLRELGTPLFDMSGPTPFVGVQTGFDALFPRQQIHSYWKSQYVEELSDPLIDVMAARAQERPAPLTLLNTFHMGGAIAAVDPEATAFADRTSPYMISIDGMWPEASQTNRGKAWVRSTFDEISRYGTGGVYLNFTGRDEELTANVDSAFGRNLARLAEVKAAYDPENFFRLNDNIAPAG
jgi:FAD/FMN-containing dehydrogenase